MFKGMLTELLSESLVQVMVGVGLPVALQNRVTETALFTVWFPEM